MTRRHDWHVQHEREDDIDEDAIDIVIENPMKLILAIARGELEDDPDNSEMLGGALLAAFWRSYGSPPGLPDPTPLEGESAAAMIVRFLKEHVNELEALID